MWERNGTSTDWIWVFVVEPHLGVDALLILCFVYEELPLWFVKSDFLVGAAVVDVHCSECFHIIADTLACDVEPDP